MGSPISQVAQSTQPDQPMQPQGKSGAINQAVRQTVNSPAVVPQQGYTRPMGKGGRVTYPGQSGQPQYGQPNQYSNTVGPWDNATIGNQQPQTFGSGKGKGA